MGEEESQVPGRTGKSWTDHRMEILIGQLLRAGVMLAAAVVLLGGACTWFGMAVRPPTIMRFMVSRRIFAALGGIVRQALALRGKGIIQLGLLLLIATPVARVAFSIFGFAEEHDRMYVVITVIVLSVLIYSLMGSPGL